MSAIVRETASASSRRSVKSTTSRNSTQQQQQQNQPSVDPQGDEKKRKRRRNLVSFLLFFSASVAGACVSLILFLVPFAIDPAITALRSDIRPAEAGCRVRDAKLGVGLSQCNWTSCLEGCTRTLFKCFQIRVAVEDEVWRKRIEERKREAELETEGGGIGGFFYGTEDHKNPAVLYDSEVADPTAVLLVNTRGCGYPPKVSCERFFQSYGNANLTFPCYFSRRDPTVALPEFDADKEKRTLALSAIPFVVLAVALAMLAVAIRVARRMDREQEERELLFGDELDVTSLGSGCISPRETPPPSTVASRSRSPLPPLPSPSTKRTMMAELAEQMQQVTRRRMWAPQEGEEIAAAFTKRIRH